MGTFLLLPLIAAAGDFTPLGLKPGLWEMTMTSKVQLSEAMLANMPPDRRAQMEAMMNGRAGQPMVVKSCLTKESMSKALNFNSDQKKNCQYNVVSSSATRQQVDVACTTDKGRTTGTMTFEATSPESGKAIMQMSQDGGTKMNITINSRYLGLDCGDVKPR
jgi:glutamate synthase domain-containing protein 2